MSGIEEDNDEDADDLEENFEDSWFKDDDDDDNDDKNDNDYAVANVNPPMTSNNIQFDYLPGPSTSNDDEGFTFSQNSEFLKYADEMR